MELALCALRVSHCERLSSQLNVLFLVPLLVHSRLRRRLSLGTSVKMRDGVLSAVSRVSASIDDGAVSCQLPVV